MTTHTIRRSTEREALRVLLEATDPYVEEAAPQETLFGPWAHHHEMLMAAREKAAAVLEMGR